MMIPDHLQERIDRFQKMAELLPDGDPFKEDLLTARMVFLNVYGIALDMDYDTALGLAESMAMAHPNYEKAADVTAMEKCLYKFAGLQALCESIAGTRPWMRHVGTWAKTVYQSAMKPLADSTWNNIKPIR